jgi:hypothetical protein
LQHKRDPPAQPVEEYFNIGIVLLQALPFFVTDGGHSVCWKVPAHCSSLLLEVILLRPRSQEKNHHE